MIADIIIFSTLFVAITFTILFFVCYSAMFNHKEYTKIIQLYNDIFKNNIDIPII